LLVVDRTYSPASTSKQATIEATTVAIITHVIA
jgi:hypothetical protein